MLRNFSVLLTSLLLGGTIAFAQLGSGVAAALDREATLITISSADHDGRDRLIAEIESKIRSAGDAVAALQQKTGMLTQEAQKAFKDAHTDVRQKEDHLKQSLHTAKTAKKDGWTEARSAIKARFTVYADAVAQLEAAANPSK
ncbi:MAG: hypothetical protein JNK23_05905 [Opitutaceae bacterium]|nr:hypothetical protein [Opitutaceae bacterium]